MNATETKEIETQSVIGRNNFQRREEKKASIPTFKRPRRQINGQHITNTKNAA